MEFSDRDFNLWELEEHGLTYYHLSIEGYMGFEKLKDIIGLYEQFLDVLQDYISDNYPEREDYHWKRIYKTRAIEVCYEHDYFWVFLDTYRSTDIWDMVEYMQDVIEQLKQIKE